MKKVMRTTAALVIGSLSFGVYAAEELQREKVEEMNLTKIGTITTSDTTEPMDARRELSEKADEMGGKYFVVIGGEKKGRDIYATADVYK